MPDLDDITQKILLEGDQELLEAFDKIGKNGAEAIERIADAAVNGAGRMEVLAATIAAIGGAVATGISALVSFIETEDSLTQKTAFLAAAFGATTNELLGIEAAFAQAGVSAQTFERFANRLTVSIAQQWPEIAANIRSAATEQDQAQERMVAANIRVKEAQNAVADNAADTSSRLAAANSRVEHSYEALKFAAQDAASAATHAMENVRGSTLSVEGAQQRLNTLLGHPPTEGEKQILAINEAQLAVDKARQAQTDARLAQQKQQAEAAQKQRDLEQAAADAIQKRHEAEESAILRTLQLENQRREAATAAAAAEERVAKLRVTNVVAITEQLQGIIKSGKDASTSVDLTQVSVRNLERAVFNLASVGGKEPTGLQTMLSLSRLLKQATEEQIPASEQLALVQKLSATSLANTGASASELLRVLKGGEEGIRAFNKASEDAFAGSKEGVENIEAFKGAFERLSLTLSLIKQNLAAAASPTFTAFLTTLNDSLTKSDGYLHLFIDGIKGIGAILESFGEAVSAIGHKLDAVFNVPQGTVIKAVFTALIGLVALFGGALTGIPAVMAVIVVTVGYIYDNFDKLKAKALDAWESIKDNSVTRFVERLIDVFKQLGAAIEKVKGWLGFGGGGASADAKAAAGTESGTTNPQAFATGGQVEGPGTATSDSIIARLSRGEFVVKAAAVQAYGANLFHSLNDMAFPGFATGGLVPSPVRMAGNGSVPATSTLNLSIDGRSFNGLRGPKSTVDDLSSFAISRQTSAAGANPSWLK